MEQRLGRKGLVILDRDGVINRDSSDFVKSAAEWVPLEGSVGAIAALSRAGYTVAVASNQSGLARGRFDRSALRAMHRKLRKLVSARGGRVDRIVVCPHGPADGCDCRKPAPGLLQRLARHYRSDLAGVPVIGDSLRDLQAAARARAPPPHAPFSSAPATVGRPSGPSRASWPQQKYSTTLPRPHRPCCGSDGMIRWLRSLLGLIFGVLGSSTISITLLLLFWAPARWRRFVLVHGCRILVWAGDFLCGMKVVVEGTENIPASPSVIMIKHTTILETYGHVPIFPPTAWVVKRELLWVPIVGWAIGLVLNPIAINRGKGRSAVKQVIEKGKERLAAGIWVTIFPEGTRVPRGETRTYGVSGAALAKEAGVQIVPVAHNADDVWRRREFSLRPGTVRFCIGPPIDATAQSPRETNLIVQAWIEAKMHEISGAYKNRKAENSADR